MPITKPFQVTTTIVTTVDPSNPEHLAFEVDIQPDPDVEIPKALMYGLVQAACEHTFEHLAEESSVGVQAEVVEEPEPVKGRCSVGNLLQFHSGRSCSPSCEVDDRVIDVECVEVAV